MLEIFDYTVQQEIVPAGLNMDSEPFFTADHEFWALKVQKNIFLRDIRGFLVNWAFFAVFAKLNRRKHDRVKWSFLIN